VERSKIVGLLLVGFALLGVWYFVFRNKTTVAGAPAGVTGSLAALLHPGAGGPATVNAQGNIISPVRPNVAFPSASAGSSGSFPNIVGNASALVSAIGNAIQPGPGQAPAPAVSSSATVTVGQAQGLADLSALTTSTQIQTQQISTYDALPSTLVDPGYGAPSPDIAANVTGLDTAALPALDFSDASQAFA
jgi:hypothetical protein